MEKQFVPYELAIKLKEKGFDEKCLAYYDGWNGKIHLLLPQEGSNFIVKILKLFTKTKQETFTQSIVENYYTGICTAPIWQQAIDWLEEKHDISLIRNFDNLNDEVKKWRYIVVIGTKAHSYHENKEEAIKQMIELI